MANIDIGYAKDNEGKPIKAYPMKVLGDNVIIENIIRHNKKEEYVMKAGIPVKSDKGDDNTPIMVGRWTIVAIGETASRMFPELKVGQNIGIPSNIAESSPIQHPILAHGIRDGIYDEYIESNDVFNGLCYRYANVRAGSITTIYYKHDELEENK